MPQRQQQHRQQGGAAGSGGPRTNGGMNSGATSAAATLKKDTSGPATAVREDAALSSAVSPSAAAITTGGGCNDAKNTYNVPDNQQLFVGNIPPAATEQDLQDLFKQFGNVIGFRLQNSKTSSTGGVPGGKTSLPNFGFVLFDSPEPVRKLLGEGQKTQVLALPGKAPVTLNIEQKKPRTAGKGSRGGPSVGGRPPMTNGGGRRDYTTSGGDRRPPRTGMGARAQSGRHDGQVGPTQH